MCAAGSATAYRQVRSGGGDNTETCHEPNPLRLLSNSDGETAYQISFNADETHHGGGFGGPGYCNGFMNGVHEFSLIGGTPGGETYHMEPARITILG